MTVELMKKYVREPAVYYTPYAFQLRRVIVAECKEEVGWMGLGKWLPNGDALIHDLVVLPQEYDETECEFTDEAVADWAEEVLEAGGDTEEFILWGHSHVNMGVGQSTTDMDTAEKYVSDCPMFICCIYNKQGESQHHVYDRKRGIKHRDVHSDVYIPPLSSDEYKAIKATIKKNLTPLPIVTTYGKGGKGIAAQHAAYVRHYGTANAKSGSMVTVPSKTDDETDEDSDTLTLADLESMGYVAPVDSFFYNNGTDINGMDETDYRTFFLENGYNGSSNEVFHGVYGSDVWDTPNQNWAE